MNNKVNTSLLLVGRQQYGKSFFARKLAIKKMSMGGFAFVYNIGRPSDWEGFTMLVPVTPELVYPNDTKKRRVAENSFNCVTKWLIEGTKKIVNSNDIAKVFKGKGVCVRLSLSYEKQIFECIFRYFHSGILIMDDFKSVTRHGFKDYHFQLYSRQNHCGALSAKDNIGCDIITIYHNINHAPPSMWDYITHCVIFQLLVIPQTITNENEVDEPLKAAAARVKELPKYSFAVVDLKDEYKTFYYTHKQ